MEGKRFICIQKDLPKKVTSPICLFCMTLPSSSVQLTQALKVPSQTGNRSYVFEFQQPPLMLAKDFLLRVRGGSWVVISRVISKVTIRRIHIKELIAPRTTTHEPASNSVVAARVPRPAFCTQAREYAVSFGGFLHPKPETDWGFGCSLGVNTDGLASEV